MTSLNTHDYDRCSKVSAQYADLLKRNPPKCSLETAVNNLKKKFVNNSNALQMLVNVAAQSGVDEKGIDAHNLIRLIWDYVEQHELEDFIVEQFEEIRNGPCIQGRTMRLLQTALALYP